MDESYICLFCGEDEDPDEPGLHLNPDLDLDHVFVSATGEDDFDDLDFFLDDMG